MVLWDDLRGGMGQRGLRGEGICVYYYSAIKRNKFESVVGRWMNLEPLIRGEVSQ